jgi:transposase
VHLKGKLLPGKYRSYSPEFREEAARLVVDTSRSIADVARELGVKEGTLGTWVTQYRRNRAGSDAEPNSDDRDEVERLKRELRELRMENEFLKKAAAYFAADHR